MNHSRTMKRVFLILAALALSASKLAADNNKPAKPNIVLILADDLGWSDVGCYGGEIPTPHIDALAKGGLRFTQFYNNAVCGPSRASLLTGLYAQRIGHTGAHWNQPTDFKRSMTLGEALQRAGYHTMMVGKWQDPDLPTKRGFHRFFGPMCAGKISYFNEVQHNPFYLDMHRVRLPNDFYLTDALTDHALKFLDDRAAKPVTNKKPFFFYVAHIAPHWPLHAREADIAPHRARYRERGWDEWRAERLRFQRANGLVPAAWTPAPRPTTVHAWAEDQFKDWQAERMAVYAAQVASIDRSTGRILDALRERGELENTLVLFMSDNGAAPDGGVKPSTGGFGFNAKMLPSRWRLDGKGIRVGSGPDLLPGPADTFAAYGLAWATVSNTPFRNTKLTGYEGGIRTPLIAHWPAGIAARGRIVNDAGHFIDLMPTFLELAGSKYPTVFNGRKPLPLDGHSLAPVFRGEPLGLRDFLAWRVPQHRVFRAGDWKIISKNENSPWELYDLARDGAETTNLAAQHPDIVKDLTAKWQAWADGCGAKRR
ncbi:MAG: arylsulfatase [Verrucomicrobia bacterium]|nr:arylsulfatase [Verrucomicrobiota bacterium]